MIKAKLMADNDDVSIITSPKKIKPLFGSRHDEIKLKKPDSLMATGFCFVTTYTD